MRASIALLVAVFLSVLPRMASADEVGLVVLGDVMTRPTSAQADAWLRSHGQSPNTTALPQDALKVLQDCFLTDDPKCSSSVIDARATTPSLIAIRVEVASKTKDVRLTIDWFVKGHAAVTARRTCEACTEPSLRATLDAMLLELAKSKPGFMGRIKVASTPAGQTVMVDGVAAGITPLEHDVPVGPHKIRLAQDGRMGREKSLTIVAGAPLDVELDNPPPPEDVAVESKSSRVVPGVLIGVGVAGIGAGAALYLTSEEPTGKNRTYRDTKTLGLAVAGGGAALAITGVIIILVTGHDSGPTVSPTAGGATVGWIGRF